MFFDKYIIRATTKEGKEYYLAAHSDTGLQYWSSSYSDAVLILTRANTNVYKRKIVERHLMSLSVNENEPIDHIDFMQLDDITHTVSTYIIND